MVSTSCNPAKLSHFVSTYIMCKLNKPNIIPANSAQKAKYNDDHSNQTCTDSVFCLLMTPLAASNPHPWSHQPLSSFSIYLSVIIISSSCGWPCHSRALRHTSIPTHASPKVQVAAAIILAILYSLYRPDSSLHWLIIFNAQG